MKANEAFAAQANPIISVILPVHNAGRYLEHAIRSVLSQTFEDFELVALDDGSTDNSLSTLQNFAHQDSRVRVFSRGNRGLATTLNELVELSRGRYIARMDADDICKPERLAKQLAFLEANSSLAMAGTAALWIDEADRPICEIFPPTSHDDIDNNNLRGKCSIIHPTVMIKRKVLIDNKYNEKCDVAQDLELWLRIARNHKISNIPEILFLYRIHDKAASSSKKDLQNSIAKNICVDEANFRGIKEFDVEIGEWRASDTKESVLQFSIDYAWRAWSHGYRDTWRHYSLKAIATAPLCIAAWRPLILGIMKRPKSNRKG